MTALPMAALVRRFAAGAGLTALALSLLLAAGTGEARLALFGGLLALALLGWAVAFLRCVARQVADFTDELCRTLDGMLDRSARPAPAAPAETLSARLNHRLERLYHTMEANRQAVEREKASLETLISNIAHQVRTPAANLRMLYDTLLARPVPWAQQRQFLQAAQGQLDKLDFLLQALVKTSRLETGVLAMTPKRHGLQQLLEDAASQAAPKAEAKGIALTVEPADLTARFDPKWTTEALYNLVDNAVKYTPAGGSVTLRAVGYELFCRIDVTDTGSGIPEAEQARIFQRFYRSPSAGETEGVGIGLYLARQIAAGQGGISEGHQPPGGGQHLLPVPAASGAGQGTRRERPGLKRQFFQNC